MWLQLYIIDMLKSFHIWYIEFFRPGKQEGAENCKDWFLTWPEAPDIWKHAKDIVPYVELSPGSRWTFAGPMRGGTQCRSHNTEEGSDIKSSYMPSCSWPDNHPSTSYQECRRFHWCRCRHNQGWCNCFSPYVRMSSLCRMVRKTLLLKRSDLRITCRLGSCCHQASC